MRIFKIYIAKSAQINDHLLCADYLDYEKQIMFTGRQKELNFLEKTYRSQKGDLLVISGRRRVGKSTLIEKFAQQKRILRFEGLEGEGTKAQIKYFTDCLYKQTQDSILKNVTFDSWNAVFDYLTSKLDQHKEKQILVFDELQWMAVGQGKLISLIKVYWDNDWKKKNILFILCGSIASFMVKKVIKSKALYGRITAEIHLKGLKPHESIKMFKKKRGFDEVLKYLLVFGGIPKYLELIDLNKSFNQNLNDLCFHQNAIMLSEFEKIFYSQFKRYKTYIKIIKRLKKKMLTLQELSQSLKMTSGGGLQRYLNQLEEAEFTKSYIPFGQKQNSKIKKYKLFDEFLLFYFQFMEPHLRTIQESSSKKIFELVTQKNWDIWCGFAFERFCLKHAHQIAKVMGFADEVLSVAPYFQKKDAQFQIDMLYKRADQTITLCEIKYNQQPVEAGVVAEVEKKVQLLKIPRGYTLEKALICVHDASPAVKATEYFHHIVKIEKIFNG